uniref:Histone H4 n=1 Tax=Lepeophtheirus salmonis TaxID=72036 RepID=D3PGB8_LEPSM|nr:Histone H4 [Lepeophtheirus salmonis]
MAVSGKSGKISGKGGKIAAAKRHKKTASTDAAGNISKPSLRRLARRAGIKRLSTTCFVPMQKIAEYFLSSVLEKTTTYADHSKRKTIIVQDITYSLKDLNMSLMGF